MSYQKDEIIAALVCIGKLIKLIRTTETSFAPQWRATPFGVTFESVDYKEDELSNHVIRSFITSSMRLPYKSLERLQRSVQGSFLVCLYFVSGLLAFRFRFTCISSPICLHFLSIDNEMVIKCVLAPFWGLFVDLPLVQRLMVSAGVGIVFTQGSSKMVGT